MKAISRTLLRVAAYAAAFFLVAFALLVMWLRYWALPHVDDYRESIMASIASSTGMATTVRAIRGGWDGLRPSLTLEDFRITDHRGRVGLSFERADATLSWWTLLGGHVRFHDLDFYRPALTLRRGVDGLIYLADKPLNETGPKDDSAFVEWLLVQPRLGIHDATLTWRDEKAKTPEVRLSSVEIAMRKQHGRHYAALTAAPPRELAAGLDLRAEVNVVRDGKRLTAAGEFYGETRNADVGRLRSHVPVPESLRSGRGSLRVWVKFNEAGVHEVVADLSLRDAVGKLADDALPIELASIAGRARYRAEHNGFTFATEALRFRMANGLEAQPGSFSITRTRGAGEPQKVQVRADGIDLKIAATMLDYFPVPRDVKGQVLRYAPRGRIREAEVGWTGGGDAPVASYAVKGRFEDLAVNAVDAAPGVSGLTGRIEGTEKGGTIEIASKGVRLELERIFRDALAIDVLEVRAAWKPAGAQLEVRVEEARFANADAQGRVSGLWRSMPLDGRERAPGYIDLKGTFSRAEATRVAAYMPNRLERTRDWLERAIQAGVASNVAFELKGDLYHFPFADGSGRFLVEGDVRDGKLKYHPDWPSVDAIQGRFKFENARMEIRAERAAIFGSRVNAVVAEIESFAVKPPVLTVNGDVDTTGADTVRFLRESPLANGPGAFTRVVAIEGPGRFKLGLVYPLGGGEGVRVNGEYSFAGATASVSRALAMRDVRGRLSFTRSSVSAPSITGTMFGQPATLTMATQPDGQMATQIDGRIDAAAMSAYMPDSLAARLSGSAEWKARVVSGKLGTDIAVTSDLKGFGSTLPEPLAKAADDARPASLTMSRVGADNEVVVFALDGAVHGRFNRAAPGGERWNAALKFGAPIAEEPQREGLWLYGRLDTIDVDAWQAVVGAARPAEKAAEAPPREAIELRGIELKLAHAHFKSRDFVDVEARLRRESSRWLGRIDSPKLAGEIDWDSTGKGRLAAKFERLSIGESAPGPAAQPAAPVVDLPALDVAAEQFSFRTRALGRFVLKAEPTGDEWRIDKLDIDNAHSKFGSKGVWRRTGDGSLTTLSLRVESQNLNALLLQFGFGDTLRGTGSLEGTLVWPGQPQDFAIANMAGSFKVEARRGQFAKIDPGGAGKLLGIISLQSLPRLATFDFSDVFSGGFAFERINGDVKIARGVLLTDAFDIVGPAALVSMKGEVSLPAETQSLNIHIVPEVGESVALAATFIGTPVLGLSTLLVSKLLKNPLGKVVAYEYQVTGPWDNPQVARLSAPPPHTAANPSPPAVSTQQQ
jgi:uncharacterized protein (TIGR02099 family)